jgi:predicted metalloprotease with PDZ domain
MKESPAKAQRRKEVCKHILGFPLRLSLRLCALAGDSFPKLTALLIFLICSASVAAANDQSRVTISIPTPGVVRVEAELTSPMRSWSFQNAYAGVLGMAERITDFAATAPAGQDAVAKKIATGEFRSELDAIKITYTVTLSNPRVADLPYVSWLAADRGFLMFLDLVPQDLRSLSATFVLPADWTVGSVLTPDAAGRYEVLDPEKSVFMVGKSLRKANTNVDGVNLEFVLNGKWRFKDAEALQAASHVLREHLELTGFKLPGKVAVLLAPFPVNGGSSEWKGETRGSTVVLLVNAKKFEDFWWNKLSIILSHEMLHLWVPNSLQLEGDYDWFYEGFTMYMTLVTLRRMAIIPFKETLDTMAGVYDAYLSRPDDVSLVQASETRWTTPLTNVYYKGMLVAFLYDLKLRKESGGKATLASRYRELFSRPPAANANGNEVIIALLEAAPAMSGFAKEYVAGATKIELEKVLPVYGLTLDSSGKKSQLRVSPNLSDEQKQLLRTFGYEQ